MSDGQSAVEMDPVGVRAVCVVPDQSTDCGFLSIGKGEVFEEFEVVVLESNRGEVSGPVSEETDEVVKGSGFSFEDFIAEGFVEDGFDGGASLVFQTIGFGLCE